MSCRAQGGRAAQGVASLAAASDRLREGRLDEVEADGTTYRIARIQRLVSWGADGPETPPPRHHTGPHGRRSSRGARAGGHRALTAW
ncbi:DUF5954 family protein [Streptomyces sp. NPDC047803]